MKQMCSENEKLAMVTAIFAAARGLGHTRPNPPVGAAIVKNGQLIASGFHRKAGEPHAEVMALAEAGEACRGATLFVTLEPCSTPGRVGACTNAIAAAGISRVVYGVPDPNPKNRGRAARILRRKGITCERFVFPEDDPEVGEMLTALIAPFKKHVTTGLPYVTVKLAMSLDGRSCDAFGESRWISDAKVRKMTGHLRRAADAIMVGGETVRRDNPSLLSHGRKNPDLIRVIISKSGNLPKDAQVFTDKAPNKTLVFDDPRKALEELGRMGCLHVLCEGGATLAADLAHKGLVDEWLTVVSPCVIGSAPLAEKVVFSGCTEKIISTEDVSKGLIELLEA